LELQSEGRIRHKFLFAIRHKFFLAVEFLLAHYGCRIRARSAARSDLDVPPFHIGNVVLADTDEVGKLLVKLATSSLQSGTCCCRLRQ
jgi:hypothetical protein